MKLLQRNDLKNFHFDIPIPIVYRNFGLVRTNELAPHLTKI